TIGRPPVLRRDLCRCRRRPDRAVARPDPSPGCHPQYRAHRRDGGAGDGIRLAGGDRTGAGLSPVSDVDGDALGIAAAVRGGSLSAVAVAEAALARIASRDPALNSFTAVTEARALGDARAVDAALARGDDPG